MVIGLIEKSGQQSETYMTRRVLEKILSICISRAVIDHLVHIFVQDQHPPFSELSESYRETVRQEATCFQSMQSTYADVLFISLDRKET